MSFLMGLSVGSILGFLLASFCVIAARTVQSLSAETASPEEVKEVA
ncbi:MAG: hypothetical protein P4L55_14490 [Syntrophobacteraceae bacterium]|nr:hypothetical protein [Syntrophobacteraceae bacterium]